MADPFLVLVENEVTTEGRYDFWKDITGVQYHYPNAYKNMVRPGAPFLYYRGAGRASGERGRPEYFGRGIVGAVWQDPETSGPRPYWYAKVEDYEPFVVPVAARRADGSTFETPPGNSGNRYFGVGVRRIPEAVYETIVAAAGLSPATPSPTEPFGFAETAELVRLPPEAPGLLVRTVPGPGGGFPSSSRSKRAKAVGDLAEGLVFQHLESSGKKPRWVAREGLHPGWDIEYIENGKRIAVEVKGTTAAKFSTIELTANEWSAAQQERASYHLYLVAGCGGTHPVFDVLMNPAAEVAAGDLHALPSMWALSRA